jgi:uncharacterized membrane protein
MQFAVALPWWVLLLLAIAVAAIAWASYAGAIVPLPRGRRAALSTLRALTLLLLVAFLLRPVRVMPPDVSSAAIVAVLVDASRSMRLADAQGQPRIDAAHRLLREQVLPGLDGRFQSEVWTFGRALEQVDDEGVPWSADAAQSDLSGALRAIGERYRGRRLAAVIVVSDGGATGAQDAAATATGEGAVPVYAVGVGATRVASDLEVLDVSAGEGVLAGSSVDLGVAAVRRGSADPFDLRVLENGRPIDLRRVTPSAEGSPVREVFTVSPSRDAATLYTVEIPTAAGELVLENNRRSVLVEPPGRRRRILVVEGAPGFEHTFIKRALAADPAIDLDSVVRKGRDARGDATYLVQSTVARAPRLARGFPGDRAALYQYDALVLANVELDALSRAQLQMAVNFVGERGGGLLVLGAKSFAQRGLAGTVLEEVLPMSLADRGSGIVRTSAREEAPYALTVTADGERHPVMRIGAGAGETASRWRAVPALAGAAALGALRPGARALALVQAPDGPRPLVAVQRVGQGRSMVFAGEASWRWRMQLPSDDRTHELFWRQAVRWLSSGAPDPVSVAAPGVTMPDSAAAMTIDVRDREFAPVADAEVTVRVTAPGGETSSVRAVPIDPREGRYAGELRVEQPGIYRVRAEARRGGESLGAAERWMLVGGADLETADPRLNEDVLRRLATATGGRYLSASDAGKLPSLLTSARTEPAAPRVQELWHNSWAFAAVVMLLAAEWMLRRRWGLR